MNQNCDPPDSDDLGDGFLCDTCVTEESRDSHEPCPEDPRNETTRVPGNTEGTIPKERTTITAHTRPKTAFTKARIVSTTTTYGRQRGRESEDSLTGLYPDPTEFSEDDDNSNPRCSPLRCTIPRSDSSDDVVGLDTSSESSNSTAELKRGESARTLGFSTRERRDRLLGRAADRVKELASLLHTPVSGRRGADATLSKADIKQKIKELCTMQRHLKELM